MPYLLIRWVVLPITCVKMEMGILMGNLVPHGTLKSVVIDQDGQMARVQNRLRQPYGRHKSGGDLEVEQEGQVKAM